MEQNQVSDEELIQRINKVLNDSKDNKKKELGDTRAEEIFYEKFHDVSEAPETENQSNKLSEVNAITSEKNLVLENHYLSLQLQAEKKKAKELQSKFKLFESSVKYFERLNGQLENIKRAVDEDFLDLEKGENVLSGNLEGMQKIRPKTVHTTSSGGTPNGQDTADSAEHPPDEDGKSHIKEEKEEVAFRDAEDFKQLEKGLEIVKDKIIDSDGEVEKVFITKTEKRCLEDIGNLAARTRTPLDEKHQRFFEKERRKFANSIVMPEIQELEKVEDVPPEIISKTKETPVNLTSTELDGLRTYLLQLKELIARRETAWARTTERDYNQRVEITRFKNEVGHLRMLCEKRQRDVKERDLIIANKEEEIKELKKKVQGLRSVIMKLEKKDEKLIDTLVEMETMENSQIVQKSYNAMKRQSFLNRSSNVSNVNIASPKVSHTSQMNPQSRGRDAQKKSKNPQKKSKNQELLMNDDEKSAVEKTKHKISMKDKPKSRTKNEDLVNKTKEACEKVDEKLQKVEEMLHSEVLNQAKRSLELGKSNKRGNEFKVPKTLDYGPFPSKKTTPSNSSMRQEMLAALTGLNTNSPLNIKGPPYSGDAKRNQPTAAVIANALLAARNANLLNYQL